MSEGSEHAAILIAASYQALNRAVRNNPETLLTDCTALILFAGFYVEATLNYILEQTKQGDNLRQFPLSRKNSHGKSHPGMQDKLAWFYNEFIAENKVSNWSDLYRAGVEAKLRERFLGFEALHKFRNDISHGEINESAQYLAIAKLLRQQAKDLVNQLYDIALEKGYEVPRLMTYRDALILLGNNKHIQVTESSAS